jgi:DMSO/TMAO reductase YedYZ molybdopterin-dependent catalytic subunit
MSSEPPLPPGQALTRKFPLVGERDASAVPPLAAWRLEVDGLLDPPLRFTWEEFRSLPQKELTADIHCVTGWTHLGMRFTGVPLADLLGARGSRVRPEARFVRFVAWSPRSHDTSLPLERALAETWLVHSVDGRPLSPEHGGPLRTVTPSRYFYKSVKWLRRIEFLAVDRLGYWERESSYHNGADPWPGDERYVTGSHAPEEIDRFRRAASYVPYRGPKKILLGVDLRGWSPATRDLGDLHLKNCDLRGAHLSGADLRGANLTRSDFAGATLAAADLRGAALSATRFVAREEDGRIIAAKIDGMRWDEDAELLEDQERFLRGE